MSLTSHLHGSEAPRLPAATASADEVAAIVAAVLRELRGTAGLDRPGGHGVRRVLDERNFRRIEKFHGEMK